jgi:hypothetical protein
MAKYRLEQKRENPYRNEKDTEEEVEEENVEKEEERWDVDEESGEQEGMANVSGYSPDMSVQKVTIPDITLSSPGTLQQPPYTGIGLRRTASFSLRIGFVLTGSV